MKRTKEPDIQDTRTPSVTLSSGIAIIGAGYWGKNLIRHFHELGVLRLICNRPWVYLLFLSITDKKEKKFANFLTSFAVSLMHLGFFFIYIITYQDLHWHLKTSPNRLLLQLWPSIVFAFFLLVRSPEEAPHR